MSLFVGYDKGKNIKRRKRFLTVNSLGLVLRVLITAASIGEREGGKRVLSKVKQMKPSVFRQHTIIHQQLDTFAAMTDGWLAIDSQDLDALGWPLITSQIELVTARGEAQFDIYSGRVIIDGLDVNLNVHVGEDLPETIMGSFWLDVMRLVADKPNGILTLEMVQLSE